MNVRAQQMTILSAAVVLACCAGAREEQRGTLKVERTTIGDTTIVRTLSGSVWDGPVTMREDLAIGTLEGKEEVMFGRIGDIAVDAKGGIYVFDGTVPALRYYDSTGTYVRTLGAKGAGPGEYQDAVKGLAVRSDGKVVMRDPRNARLNVYDSSGAPTNSWQVTGGLFVDDAMVLDTADHAFIKILFSRPEPNKPWNIGLLHLDAQGQYVDSIPSPKIAGEPTDAGGAFSPDKHWAFSPLGYMVVGVNSAYRFELRHANGAVVRIERETPTVQVLPQERAEYAVRDTWYRKQPWYMSSDVRPLPTTKPPYSGFLIGRDGRVWVRRHVLAEKLDEARDATSDSPPTPAWIEPHVYDVFEPDGTFLGEVHVPKNTRLMLVRSETGWGSRQGDNGALYVVRLRIDHRTLP